MEEIAYPRLFYRLFEVLSDELGSKNQAKQNCAKKVASKIHAEALDLGQKNRWCKLLVFREGHAVALNVDKYADFYAVLAFGRNVPIG